MSTRLAIAEAGLRALEEILADVLDILAEVKAKQDEMPQDHDARRTDQRRRWWQRLGNNNSIFGRARLPIQSKLMLDRALLKSHHTSVLDEIPKDDLAFWKGMGRTAITGLFLMTVFMIGLYQLLNHN